MYLNPDITAEIMSIPPRGTNSTMFTNCCETAICDDERHCPRCGRNVIGHDADTNYQRGRIRWANATRMWSR